VVSSKRADALNWQKKNNSCVLVKGVSGPLPCWTLQISNFSYRPFHDKPHRATRSWNIWSHTHAIDGRFKGTGDINRTYRRAQGIFQRGYTNLQENRIGRSLSKPSKISVLHRCTHTRNDLYRNKSSSIKYTDYTPNSIKAQVYIEDPHCILPVGDDMTRMLAHKCVYIEAPHCIFPVGNDMTLMPHACP
jgi:hypothetical protein